MGPENQHLARTDPNLKGRESEGERGRSDLSTYKEGDLFPSLGKTIETLIYASDQFIVFLDEDDIIQWDIGDDYGEYPKDFADVVNRVSFLETLSMTRLPRRHQAQFRRLLAEGIARLMGDGNPESAKSMLDNADRELNARSIDRARLWYLMASSSVFMIFILTTYALWVFKYRIELIVGKELVVLLIGAGLGSLGAIISVILRSRDRSIDPSAGALVHYFEGTARIVVGMAGAFLIALAVKANLLLGVANATGESADAFLYVMCIVAGASERLVPNLIQQVESSYGSESDKRS